MRKLSPQLPQNAKVSFNYLYEGAPASSLGEDVFHAVLATGVHLDVGWFPESDPNGSYIIRAFRRSSTDALELRETKDVHKAVEHVEGLARQHSVTVTLVSYADVPFAIRSSVGANYRSSTFVSQLRKRELV